MSFSVIVPVLNGNAHLRQCLDSILAQDQPMELIVIDGGSTDGSLDTLKSYRDSIDYLETGKDSGIADAFNRGLAQATGDYIAILNSDDYWEPEALSRVSRAIGQHPQFKAIYGQCRMHHEDGRSFIKKPQLSDMKKYMSLCHCSLFVHREIYARIGVYDTTYSLAMDSEWVHRAIAKEIVFQKIPKVLCNMRFGGISDTRGINALREYRRSVIDNRLAHPLYAHAFFLLHCAMKLGYRIPPVARLKAHYDSKYNRTVDIQ